MRFPRICIAPKSRRGSTKTRRFRGSLLGYLTADRLWDLGAGSDGALRPVWLACFATVGEYRALTANLRAGRTAEVDGGPSLQVPRSSSHRWVSQPVPGGVVTAAYLPELFHLEPPVPFTEEGVGFVMAPARSWVEREAEALRPELGEDAEDGARAALFVAYLDRRTPLPLLRDLEFHLELYRAALDEPWLERVAAGSSQRSFGLFRSGLDEPAVCSVDLPALEGFLRDQTSRFHRLHGLAGRYGGPWPPVAGAGGGPLQLALDLAS